MQPGALIANRFSVEEEVHAGHMARVLRARDTHEPDRVVAVKMPLRDPARFVDEVAILELLKQREPHAPIAHLVAHDAAGEPPWATMEWLDGVTLEAQLAARRFTVAEAVAVGKRLAEALAAVHRVGAVHRDVKPGNVFLVGGTAADARLIDFGVARREGETRGLAKHASFAGGTWAYMSPEQAMGAAELGARVDVFSLGCVLFECVTGVRAYPAERGAALVAKVWRDAPRASDVCDAVPPRLASLLERLLARDPADRPRDGSAVLTLLAAIDRPPDLVLQQRKPH